MLTMQLSERQYETLRHALDRAIEQDEQTANVRSTKSSNLSGSQVEQKKKAKKRLAKLYKAKAVMVSMYDKPPYNNQQGAITMTDQLLQNNLVLQALTMIHEAPGNREGGEGAQTLAHILTTSGLVIQYSGDTTYATCAILYLADAYPACRKCYNLGYYSESETELDRAMRQARKAQERLGYHEGDLCGWLPRPKGMHHRTYQKLLRKVEYGSEVFCAEVRHRFNLCGEEFF